MAPPPQVRYTLLFADSRRLENETYEMSSLCRATMDHQAEGCSTHSKHHLSRKTKGVAVDAVEDAAR